MSDPMDRDELAGDLDGLAGEYVLGTLEGAEAAEARQRADSDPAFMAAVRAWEERLTPLAACVPAVEPPAELWERIEASTEVAGAPGATVVALRRRVRAWQASTGVALALAASLAGFVVLHPAPWPEVAVLAPITGGAPVLVVASAPGGGLDIRPNGTITVPSDRDLELWGLGAADRQPRPLGVFPASGGRARVRVTPGTQLLVSLEPRGGSPTGLPTGPVLYQGQWAALD